MKIIIGICKLCKKEKEIVSSHIIPKFVFKWLKNSGTGMLRPTTAVNKKVEDGPKIHLLCRECEAIFSKYETYFSRNIFNALIKYNHKKIIYDENLFKFIISVIWRILENDKVFDDKIDEETKSLIMRLKDSWDSIFLFNEIPDLPLIHMIYGFDIFSYEKDLEPLDFDVYYLGRCIDAGVIYEPNYSFVFLKIPRFIFVMPINGFNNSEYRNTLISYSGGEYHVNEANIEDQNLGLFFTARILQFKEIADSISDQQKNSKDRKKEAEIMLSNNDLGKILQYQREKNGST